MDLKETRTHESVVITSDKEQAYLGRVATALGYEQLQQSLVNSGNRLPYHQVQNALDRLGEREIGITQRVTHRVSSLMARHRAETLRRKKTTSFRN